MRGKDTLPALGRAFPCVGRVLAPFKMGGEGNGSTGSNGSSYTWSPKKAVLRTVRVAADLDEAPKEVVLEDAHSPAGGPLQNGRPIRRARELGAVARVKEAAAGARATLSRRTSSSKRAPPVRESSQGSLRGSARNHRHQTMLEQEAVAKAAKEEKAEALDFPEQTTLVRKKECRNKSTTKSNFHR